MRSGSIRLLALASLVAAGACVTPQSPPVPAPDFDLTDLAGKSIRLSDFRGRPVLVDFWATWCDPCRESIPSYEKLFAKRRDSGFTVVGIDEDDAATDVDAFAKANAIPYPLMRDPKRVAFESFGVRGLPTAFLVDADGRVVRRWDTFDKGTLYEVEQALDALLPKK
jgi:peroxiredoxin